MANALSPAVSKALIKLRGAISALEHGVTVRETGDRDTRMVLTELSAMREDRVKLALELDAALGKVERLEAATSDLSHRIDLAIVSVRSALDAARLVE